MKFLEVAKKVAAGKPILAMKAGRSDAGARAAASHTGGLAKEDLTTDLIFEKAGVLSFRTEGELCEAAAIFASQPAPSGNRVGIITNTGGPAVIATDALVAGGLTIPSLSGKAKEALRGRLFPEASIGNPVDVLATAGGDHFRAAMDVMMADDGIDSIYINFVTPFFVDNESIARQIVEVNGEHRKPMVCNLMTDKRQWAETVRILREGGVPCYFFPGAAARALVALTKYGEVRRRDAGRVRRFPDVDLGAAAAIIDIAHAQGTRMLSARDVYGILSAYGIPSADWRVALGAASAEKAALEIGFPVTIKVDSPTVLHKSDMHGVLLDLRNARAVKSAVKRLRETFQGLTSNSWSRNTSPPAGR